MVYIASSSMTAVSRQSILQIQSELSDVQTEVASGVSADVGLSLGARSSELVALQQQQAKVASSQSDNSFAATRLSTTVTALDSIRSGASSLLSALTTASSSGGLTTSLQTSAANSLAALTSALNTSVSGQYVFAGINTAVQPLTTYSQSPASANKAAIDSAFSTAFGFSQSSASASTISGTAMQSFLDGSFASMFSASGFGTSWSSATNGTITSEISPGQTIATSVSANAQPFRQLAQAYAMVTEFGGTNFSSDAGKAVVSTALGLVTSAIAGLTTTEAGVGTAQNAITDANTALSAQGDVLKTQMDAMAGVDQEELSTRLASLQTQLNASYSVTSQLQKLSLVNYLS
jgi:flagellar hook-associated protein 3 FlgL